MNHKSALAVLLFSTGFFHYIAVAAILIGIAAIIVAVAHAVRIWR